LGHQSTQSSAKNCCCCCPSGPPKIIIKAPTQPPGGIPGGQRRVNIQVAGEVNYIRWNPKKKDPQVRNCRIEWWEYSTRVDQKDSPRAKPNEWWPGHQAHTERWDGWHAATLSAWDLAIANPPCPGKRKYSMSDDPGFTFWDRGQPEWELTIAIKIRPGRGCGKKCKSVRAVVRVRIDGTSPPAGIPQPVPQEPPFWPGGEGAPPPPDDWDEE
jgi:hypothetical protein